MKAPSVIFVILASQRAPFQNVSCAEQHGPVWVRCPLNAILVLATRFPKLWLGEVSPQTKCEILMYILLMTNIYVRGLDCSVVTQCPVQNPPPAKDSTYRDAAIQQCDAIGSTLNKTSKITLSFAEIVLVRMMTIKLCFICRSVAVTLLEVPETYAFLH